MTIYQGILSGAAVEHDHSGQIITPAGVRYEDTYVPTGNELVGTMFYNPDGGIDYVIDEYGNITIGNELWDILTNLEGSQLVNGDVVSIVGASGNRTAMALTDATDTLKALACTGMVTIPTIDNNQKGRITKRGTVRNTNTFGLIEGAVVYVNPLIKGKYTQTKPDAGNYIIEVGIVQVAHAINGVIDVNIKVYPKVEDLSNVDGTATTILDTELILKKESSGIWKHITFSNLVSCISNALSSIFVPKTRTIRINGTEQDLSADRSYEVVADVLVDNIYVEKNTEGEITLSQKTLKRINAGI